jgi:hypothetical protein
MEEATSTTGEASWGGYGTNDGKRTPAATNGSEGNEGFSAIRSDRKPRLFLGASSVNSVDLREADQHASPLPSNRRKAGQRRFRLVLARERFFGRNLDH